MRKRTLSVFETVTAIYLSRYYPIIKASNVAVRSWGADETEFSRAFMVKGHVQEHDGTMLYTNGVFSTTGTVSGGEMEIVIKIAGWQSLPLDKMKFEHFSYKDLPKKFEYGKRRRNPRLLTILGKEAGMPITRVPSESVSKLFISYHIAYEMYKRYYNGLKKSDDKFQPNGFDSKRWALLFLAAPDKIINSTGGVVDKYGVVYLE